MEDNVCYTGLTFTIGDGYELRIFNDGNAPGKLIGYLRRPYEEVIAVLRGGVSQELLREAIDIVRSKRQDVASAVDEAINRILGGQAEG